MDSEDLAVAIIITVCATLFALWPLLTFFALKGAPQ